MSSRSRARNLAPTWSFLQVGDRVEFAPQGENQDAGVVVKINAYGDRGCTLRVRPDHPDRHRLAEDGTIGVNDFEVVRRKS